MLQTFTAACGQKGTYETLIQETRESALNAAQQLIDLYSTSHDDEFTVAQLKLAQKLHEDLSGLEI